jgi:hypothetical protein
LVVVIDSDHVGTEEKKSFGGLDLYSRMWQKNPLQSQSETSPGDLPDFLGLYRLPIANVLGMPTSLLLPLELASSSSLLPLELASSSSLLPLELASSSSLLVAVGVGFFFFVLSVPNFTIFHR